MPYEDSFPLPPSNSAAVADLELIIAFFVTKCRRHNGLKINSSRKAAFLTEVRFVCRILARLLEAFSLRFACVL